MRGRLVAQTPDDPVIVVPMRKVFQSAIGFVEGCESFEPKQLLLEYSKNRSTHPFPSGHLTRAMLSGARCHNLCLISDFGLEILIASGAPVVLRPPCAPDSSFNEKRGFLMSDIIFKSPKLVSQQIVHQGKLAV